MQMFMYMNVCLIVIMGGYIISFYYIREGERYGLLHVHVQTNI